MKLTFIFLIVACFGAAASGHSQTVTLSMKKATLENVFKAINQQTGYDFAYNDDVKAKAVSIDIKVDRADIHTTLTKCFEGLGLTYTLRDKTIIVQIKNTINEPAPVQLPIDVTGKIVNEAGEPVIATVTVKGTKNAVSTDVNGFFVLKGVREDATLIISGINVETLEFKVGGKTDLATITTKKKVIEQEEVLINTGYQKIKPNEATGSFSHVSNELLNRSVTPTILERFEGIVPGVLFNSGTSSLGFSIRGRSTIMSSTDPLIILDDFPYVGSLTNINPNDIESATILKDAGAASIWGATAGNGVLVLTSKAGKYNQPIRVSFNSNVTIAQKSDLFSTTQMNPNYFIEVENFLFDKGYYDGNILSINRPALTPVVEILLQKRNGQISPEQAAAQINALKGHDMRSDLMKYFNRKPLNQQYVVNLSGGGPNQKYYLSVGWDKNLTARIGNVYDRLTVNASNTYSLLNRKLDLTTGVVYSQSTTTMNNGGGANYPYARLADDNGNPLSIARYRQGYIDTAGAGKLLDWNYRPLDELKYLDNTLKTTNFKANVRLKYKIFPGLDIDGSFQFAKELNNAREFQSVETFYTRDFINRFSSINRATGIVTRPVPMGGILDINDATRTGINFRTQLNYNKKWLMHGLAFLGGFETSEVLNDGMISRLYGYDDEHGRDFAVDYVNLYTTFITKGQSTIERRSSIISTNYRSVSAFFNGSYSYKGRYTVSASARKDAANTLGLSTNEKWVPLWSVGSSWNIADEPFYNLKGLPSLKLRATYGFQGNMDKGRTSLMTVQVGLPNRWNLPAGSYANLPNENLRWEKTGTLNLAFDFSTKNDIIAGSIDFYWKKGVDLIGQTPMAPSSGVSNFTGNNADMKGHGVDVAIQTRNIRGVFNWTTNFLFSSTKDEITTFKSRKTNIGGYVESIGFSPIEGKPVLSLFSYQWGGLDPTTGDPRGFLNKNFSTNYSAIANITDLNEMVYNGPTVPTYFGAIRNSFGWKGVSCSFNIIYKMGYVFRRGSINYTGLFEKTNSGHIDYTRRWLQPGDEEFTTVPSLIYPANPARDKFYQYSDITVEKGDHVRFQDVQLSYDLNENIVGKKFPVKNIRVYGYIRNLGIIWRSNKSGLDPEVPDGVAAPKSFSFGISGSF
jgi:TonB-dependent starch-binding outer membrane protein SusC